MIYDKRSTIPWYIRFLLAFQAVKFSTDVAANGDMGVTIGYKTLFGTIYILSEITSDEGLDA